MPIYIEMPKLSDTMTEGTLVKWHKKIGDAVKIGDLVADVETDKATMEMESFEEGTIYQILIAEGSKVQIGTQLAILLEDGEAAPTPAELAAQMLAETPAPKETPKVETSAPIARSVVAPPQPQPSPVMEESQDGRIKASPLAKKLAATRGIPLGSIRGTGPSGRIMAKDVPERGVLVAPQSVVAPVQVIQPDSAAGPSETIMLSGMRRIIAERLFASKTQIPHFYLHIEVDAEPITRLRRQINQIAENSSVGGKITINDFILLAAARAAAANPKVNASFAGDRVIQYKEVNLAVAVAVDDGLVTPVIRSAQNLSLRQISEEVRDLAGRARSKKLKPDEYQGGTITVSNLGAYGVERFAAIINPPQAAILAIGAIVKKPVVNEKNEIIVGERMSISLSCDHRVVDGAVGAEYLAALRKLVENPALMLF